MTTMHDDTNPMAEILLKSELGAVAGGSLPPVISYVDDGAIPVIAPADEIVVKVAQAATVAVNVFGL